MLMPFIKLKCTAQILFEQKQVQRSSVPGLIIIGSLSLTSRAKELVSYALFPASWKPRRAEPAYSWSPPHPGASLFGYKFGSSDGLDFLLPLASFQGELAQ